MENILLPWVVLGMSILIKSISCGVMTLVYHVPAQIVGIPPMPATAQDPVPAPRYISSCLRDYTAGQFPVALSPTLPGPDLVQALSCPHPQEGT